MKDLGTLIEERRRLEADTSLVGKKNAPKKKKKKTLKELEEDRRIRERVKMFRKKEAKGKK